MKEQKKSAELEMKILDEGTEVVNLHGAIIKPAFVYDGKRPKAGFVWYVFTVSKKSTSMRKNKKGAMIAVAEKHRRVGGIQIEQAFEKEHGFENVKNMIIVNILNKQTFFK